MRKIYDRYKEVPWINREGKLVFYEGFEDYRLFSESLPEKWTLQPAEIFPPVEVDSKLETR